jgi:hypothetical protein
MRLEQGSLKMARLKVFFLQISCDTHAIEKRKSFINVQKSLKIGKGERSIFLSSRAMTLRHLIDFKSLSHEEPKQKSHSLNMPLVAKSISIIKFSGSFSRSFQKQ